ncbi:hypothetical protein [Salinibacterium sp. ZJ450]|uniref:hypothetical protein n=1 Tax=Salinibacterium sp. ZJ450 TaxID=2708338 RepID=UPI001422393C|nr:hypothetical protein [Salinibacterium sp. ZJ450]
MRFVLAIVSFVVAALLIGFGVAQRTVLAGPETFTATAELGAEAPLAVIDGEALNAHSGRQALSVSGEGIVFAAYGRTSDVKAWVGDAAHYEITANPETGEFVSELVEGTEATVPNPFGSDLWLADFQAEGAVNFAVNVPEDVSIIVASDGTAPVPGDVSVTWPVDNSQPWSGPLIVAGALMALLGLAFLTWAILHLRRSRGPRRTQPKQPRMPKPPRQRSVKPKSNGGAPTNARGRRASRPMIAVVPVIASALLLGGCSAGSSPESGGGAPVSEPSAASTAPAGEDLPPTAVTEAQAKRIVSSVGTTVTDADANLSADVAATRLAGPALELRAANYKARSVDGALPAVSPVVGDNPLQLTLPQQTDIWPRTVIAVTQAADADPADDVVPSPVGMVLIQDDARSQYKAHYAVTLTQTVPEVAPASIGTARLPVDNKLLSIAPSEVGPAYADVLLNGDQSASYGLFDTENDPLLGQVGKAYKDAKRAEVPTTAALTFTNAAGTGETVVMATNDLGALVAVNMTEIEEIKPTQAGAAVDSAGAVRALSGKPQSTKGFTATYAYQLLFHVPPVSQQGEQPIALLGYSEGLISASEVP